MSERCSKLGRYELAAEIGRGSMGVVHRAHDPVMGRDLAIKTILLPFGLQADKRDEFQQRFLREAQAAGRLSHPGIVTVYDFDKEDGTEQPYIAMEYVQGPTLHELISREGALSPDWVFSIAETLADALHTAHSVGIVHRDVKPANILVRESDGCAKIADFGVARLDASESTDAGTTYGSPAYMAPERIRGCRSDARSDLFSLAVIIYEALCGDRPFGGDDFASTCYSILNESPTPIRRHAPDLAAAVEVFFERALAKDPDERFQTAAAFRDALRSVAIHHAASVDSTVDVTTVFEDDAARTLLLDTRDITGSAAGVSDEPSGPAKRGIALAATIARASLDTARTIAERLQTTIERHTGRRPPVSWIALGGIVVVALIALAGLATLGGGDAGVSVAAQPSETPPVPTTGAAVVTASGADESPIEPLDLGVSELPPPVATEPPAVEAKPAAPIAAAAPSKPVTEAVVARPVETPVPDAMATAAAAAPTAEAPADEAPAAEVAALAPPPATLRLLVKHSVKSGSLSLLVDGSEVYQTTLATDAGRWSHALKKATHQTDQIIEAEIEIPAGAHAVVARMRSDGKERVYERTLDLDLEPESSTTLRIVAGRTFGKRLVMQVE